MLLYSVMQYYLCVILPPQGLTADVSTSYMDQPQGGVLLLLALNVFYVAMVIAVVSLGVEEHRGRDKNQWMLTQQLHHLDLFWLNSGPDCEVIFDPNTCSVYATLSMNLHSESKYNRIEGGLDINILYYSEALLYARAPPMYTHILCTLNNQGTDNIL